MIQFALTAIPALPSPAIRVSNRSRQQATGQVQAEHALRTPRETQVATLVASGLRRSEIASKVGISVYTVATLLQRTDRTLDARNRKALKQRLARTR